MGNDNILKNYVCITPFVYMEAHRHGVFSCCPSWLPIKISSLENIEKAWQSDEYRKIKESLKNGSYEYCSKSKCPYLIELIETGKVNNSFIPKSDFKETEYTSPTNINFAFDRSCNLSCPSCRTNKIMANEEDIIFIDETINKISEKFGNNLTLLYLSGSADPFASKSIRKMLLNFDRNKFRKLKHIHLHTNGLLLTKKLWEDLAPIHDLIKTIEISIDAATKETYEKIRRGGNWDTLIENLNYISTIKFTKIRTSFVVQENNYFEMEKFYNLMMNIFKNKVEVFFNKIQNWGTFSENDYKIKKIWDENHPEFFQFLENAKKINMKHNCLHNIHSELLKFSTIKNNKLI